MGPKTTKQNIVGKVQTVLGLIAPETMGITITHEHLLVDEAHLYHEPLDPEKKATFYAPLSMEILSRIYYSGHDNLESTTMLDEDLAIEEAMHYKRAGGCTLVEVSSIGLRRNPEGLARISSATGLHVIMGSSYYVDASHPPYLNDKPEKEISDEIIGEIFPQIIGLPEADEVGLIQKICPA